LTQGFPTSNWLELANNLITIPSSDSMIGREIGASKGDFPVLENGHAIQSHLPPKPSFRERGRFPIHQFSRGYPELSQIAKWFWLPAKTSCFVLPGLSSGSSTASLSRGFAL